MTGSSGSRSLRDSGNETTYSRNSGRRRGRSRSRSTSLSRTMNPNRQILRGPSSPIQPGDSISQFEPRHDPSRAPDFPRLRAYSPPDTSDRFNNGAGSRISTNYASGTSEWSFVDEKSSARLRRDPPRRQDSDLRKMFKDMRLGEERPYHCQGRDTEKRFRGRDSGDEDSAAKSYDSDSTIVDRPRGLKDNTRNASRGRVERRTYRRDRIRGRSTDAEVSIAPRMSNKSRGKEEEEKIGRSIRFGDRSTPEDREVQPGHHLDSRQSVYPAPSARYVAGNPPQNQEDLHRRRESRHQPDLSPPRSSRQPDRNELKYRAFSDVSSFRVEAPASRQDTSRSKFSDSLLVQPSTAPDPRKTRRRDPSKSSPYYRSSKRDSGPPLAYDKYKSTESGSLRRRRKPSSRSKSRPASTADSQTTSDFADSILTERDSHSKRSDKGPLKKR